MILTLQQAKDEAAKEIGYDNWADLIGMIGHKSLKELRHTQYELALEKAITIYAEIKSKESFEAARKLTPPLMIGDENGITKSQTYRYKDYESFTENKS